MSEIRLTDEAIDRIAKAVVKELKAACTKNWVEDRVQRIRQKYLDEALNEGDGVYRP